MSAAKMKIQRGFTLIELIVVIILVGILSAVAAPKFINLSSDAHESIYKSVAGAFKSNLNVVLAKRVVAPDGSSLQINGQTITFHENGWPQVETLADCENLWLAMLEEDYSLSSSNLDQNTYDGWVISHFNNGGYLFCNYNYTINSKLVGEPGAKFLYSPIDDRAISQGITLSGNLFD